MSDPAPTNYPTPQIERGYVRSDLGGWWDAVSNEATPDLQWPASVDTYDAMRRQDAQVSSVLRAVTSPILRTAWRIDGTGCRPEVTQQVAADLGLPIVGEGNQTLGLRGRDRFSWKDHARLALTMLPFGHSVFEQRYRFDADLGVWRLRKLGPRPQRTIQKFNVARDGGLVSIEQKPITGKAVVIPINRLVVYVHDREGGSWIGQSLLRPAYKHWLLKDRLLRVQTQSVERNGMGLPAYTNHEKGTPDDLAKGLDMATRARAGDNSGIGLPYGAKMELLGVSGDLPDADKPIRYHDEQIARAVLAHFLNLGSQTGSWALGSTFADFFTLSLQAIAEEIRDTANSHVIEDLVDINYGPDEPAPQLVFDEIGQRGDAIVNAIAVLVQNNVLKPDEDLEQFVRTALKLPAANPVAPAPTPEGVPA